MQLRIEYRTAQSPDPAVQSIKQWQEGMDSLYIRLRIQTLSRCTVFFENPSSGGYGWIDQQH